MTANSINNVSDRPFKFNYSVLVEQKDNGYQATVFSLSDCQVFAATKEDALNNIHKLVNHRLQNTEIVVQQAEVPEPDHPWLKIAGKYKEDPQFDDMLLDIAAYRLEQEREAE